MSSSKISSSKISSSKMSSSEKKSFFKLSSLYSKDSSRWPFYIISAVIILAIVYLLSPPLNFKTEIPAPATIVNHDIIAENDVEIIDVYATHILKEQAIEAKGLFFNNRPQTKDKDLKFLAAAFADFRAKQKNINQLRADFNTQHREKLVGTALAEVAQQDLLLVKTFKDNFTKATLNDVEKNSASKAKESTTTKTAAVDKIFSSLPNQQKLIVDYLNIEKTHGLGFKKLIQETSAHLTQLEAANRESLLKNFSIPTPKQEVLSNLIVALADESFEKDLAQLVAITHKTPFIQNKTLFAKGPKTTVSVIDERGNVFELGMLGTIQDKADRINFALQYNQSQHAKSIIKMFLESAIMPSLIYDKKQTQAELVKLDQDIRPVKILLKKGEILVRRGEKITKEKASLLKGYFEANTNATKYPKILSLLALVLCSIIVLLVFINIHRKKHEFLKHRRKWALISLFLLLLQLFISKFLLEISSPLFGSFSSFLQNAQVYIMPLGLSSILAVILVHYGVATALGIASAVLTSLLFTGNPNVLLFALASNILAGAWLTGFRALTRSTILLLGIKISLANSLLVIILSALNYPWISGNTNFTGLIIAILCSVFGGMSSAILATILLPLFEYLFDIKTDIKLLEWSTANHPVLKELMSKAPGSYYHSIAVGAISEAGAIKIGANALFCRIASYYHDIGKIHNPSFFIENMRGEIKNPHLLMDDPVHSKEIIIGHVAKGVALANKYRLGKELTDIIKEHHGTTLVRYFYLNAQKKLKLGLLSPTEVLEEKFRYPGPKPQSPESALIMLADVCEAAVRSLPNPNAQKISEMVKNVSNHILEDGQLDESRISLRDFKSIQAVYLDILIAQNHPRISYPKLGPKQNPHSSWQPSFLR